MQTREERFRAGRTACGRLGLRFDRQLKHLWLETTGRPGANAGTAQAIGSAVVLPRRATLEAFLDVLEIIEAVNVITNQKVPRVATCTRVTLDLIRFDDRDARPMMSGCAA